MTQEAETVAMDLNIVSCQTCDALFIESERRQTCPSCGGPPVGPYFQFVLDGSGLHQKDGVAPEAAQRSPAEEPAPEAEAPAAEASVEEESPAVEEAPDPLDVLLEAIKGFLGGVDQLELDIRDWLQTRMGAEPEAATVAVGRLAAVRDLLRELAEAGVKAQVEVQVEETPAEAPEPDTGPESAPEAP